ncbi:hypothetical protein Hanom_Chr06g00485281 [Helianthus anomalus]
MAEPSNTHTVVGENPDPSSLAAAEEEEGDAPGEQLPVLRWPKASFEFLMKDIQMPLDYGDIHPQEGDTAADAPTGYVTLWADFFGVCNLRLPLTVFVVEPTVGDFRRFYQMTVTMGFFSFRQRDGSPKFMTPPKGLTKGKTKFFYFKVAAITARLQFRNVTDTIISKNISLPKEDKVN